VEIAAAEGDSEAVPVLRQDVFGAAAR
jgi:hypothetical protein